MQSANISKVEAVFNKAEQLRENGNHEEALKEYTKVVYFAPRHWPAWFHLGVLFGQSGKNELAVTLLCRAAALNPDNPVIKNHLADCLLSLRRNDEALELLKASWSLDASEKNISAPVKMGKILRESNRLDEAMHYFDLVLAAETEKGSRKETEEVRHVSRWLRGLCRMARGEYQEAWDDYESRGNLPGVITPEIPGEQWSGQPLKGKAIFFTYEQRFGDVIQFIRFIPLLQRMGANIILQLPPQLEKLIGHSFPEVDIVLIGQSLPDYDYHQLITSVPAVLDLSKQEMLKDRAPYLHVDASGKTKPLPTRNDTYLKVGLVWAGKPDPDRSIPLVQFIPLLKHKSVSFFSLQLGDGRKELNSEAVGWLIHDLSPGIFNFHDSSVMLKDMDLLITIDTAIAHQAGALGVPVWVMLHTFSDWRWEIDRDDNDWYPSMRLFRQDTEGSWTVVARQLELAFDEWVSKSMKAMEKKRSRQH